MNIIKTYSPQIGDTVVTNINGGSLLEDCITGIIGHINYETEELFILTDERQGTPYIGWSDDAKKYNKLYSWEIDFEVNVWRGEIIFDIQQTGNKFINFLLKKKQYEE